MRNFISATGIGCFIVLFSADHSFSQCNVNDKYDKIISGYHSSIALKNTGSYAVWGSDMKNAGNADQLSPQDINNINYPTLTGTVYKVAMGGKHATSAVDQAFVLTSTGLWAWGVAGNVVSTGVKSGNSFGRTSTLIGNGFNTYGLPSTIIPTDVASLFATYQTLILLTNSGNVWVLTQANQTVEANGGAAIIDGTGSSQWKQVKIDAGTFLTNVSAVRGQVSSNPNTNTVVSSAFMALTTSGEVYTWGNTSYLGNNTANAARNFATLMTLPAEFSSSIPKMIGVTGGITTIISTKNTYYLLSEAGNLYAMGDNTQRQCGDFTTMERTGWVNVKKSAAVGDNLTSVNFFSCQEHNSSYPATAAITTAGLLYTWGNNSSGMVGRTDNGLAAGTLLIPSFDPGTPVGFTGSALSVEMGGHTMVYLKVGSSQFCYVGHYTNGSMGDGTSGNNGSAGATTLKHDCSTTPVLNICGSVPVAASAANSTISPSPSSIQADATSTSTITIQLKDGSGVNFTTSGGVVAITTTSGTLGPVTDNNNGTYTAVLTSSSLQSTATLGFSLNGTTSANTTLVNFVAILPLSWENVTAYRQGRKVKITWTTTTEVNTKSFDIQRSLNGNDWNTVIAGIAAVNQPGTNNYEQMDTSFNAKRLYYRIRQSDLDGRYSLSPVRTVPAVSETSRVTVYPVPAGNSFHLGNINAGRIKNIQLISAGGTVLRSWNVYQASYDIAKIPAGNYIIRIETNDDVQILKLIK